MDGEHGPQPRLHVSGEQSSETHLYAVSSSCLEAGEGVRSETVISSFQPPQRCVSVWSLAHGERQMHCPQPVRWGPPFFLGKIRGSLGILPGTGLGVQQDRAPSLPARAGAARVLKVQDYIRKSLRPGNNKHVCFYPAQSTLLISDTSLRQKSQSLGECSRGVW